LAVIPSCKPGKTAQVSPSRKPGITGDPTRGRDGLFGASVAVDLARCRPLYSRPGMFAVSKNTAAITGGSVMV
jgi:hypothetical protein